MTPEELSQTIMHTIDRIDKRAKIAPHHAVTMENAAIGHHFHDALADYSRPHPAVAQPSSSAAPDDCDFFSFFQTTDATLAEIRTVLEQMRRYPLQSDGKTAAEKLQLQRNLNNACLTISRLAGALALRAQQQVSSTAPPIDSGIASLTTLGNHRASTFTLIPEPSECTSPISPPERLQAVLKRSATASRRIECFTSRLDAAFTIQ